MRNARFRVLLVVAAIAVLVPATALAIQLAAADDAIPGVPLLASPVTGTADETTDIDDIYSVDLTKDQWFYASMTGSTGTDFDLYLYPPGTVSVTGTMPASAFSEKSGSSSERILFKAPQAGRYYLDVWAFKGTGSYTLRWGRPSEIPSLSASAPKAVKWAATARISGTMTTNVGAPIKGESIDLYAKPYGRSSFARVAGATTDASGTYSFSVVPSSSTKYSVRFLASPSYLPTTAAELQITPYAYVGIPTSPSTARRNVAFTSTGYLKPRHTAGTKPVKLTCYRLESGAWKARKTVYASVSNFASYSKYTARFSLPYTGKWKIVASVTGDGLHLPTSSYARYLSVAP